MSLASRNWGSVSADFMSSHLCLLTSSDWSERKRKVFGESANKEENLGCQGDVACLCWEQQNWLFDWIPAWVFLSAWVSVLEHCGGFFQPVMSSPGLLNNTLTHQLPCGLSHCLHSAATHMDSHTFDLVYLSGSFTVLFHSQFYQSNLNLTIIIFFFSKQILLKCFHLRLLFSFCLSPVHILFVPKVYYD